MPTRLSSFSLAPNALDTGRPSISSVIPMDSTYTSLATITSSGGYVRILGFNFKSNEQVYIRSSGSQSYALASVVAHVNSTEIRATLPASTSGLKMLWIVNGNGVTAMTTITYQ
jgi:hypothetical protein